VSGETEKEVSGLTVDTLRLLVDAEVRRIDERFAAFLEVYRRDQEKANEFRSALDDLSKTMATRRELESAQTAGNNRIDGLVKDVGDLRSRLDIGPAGLAPLQAYQHQQEGRKEGIGASVGLIVTIVTVTGGIVGLIVVLANHVQ